MRYDQLNRLLADIDREIAEAEAEAINTLRDEDLRKLIERQVDLQMLRSNVEAKLRGE